MKVKKETRQWVAERQTLSLGFFPATFTHHLMLKFKVKLKASVLNCDLGQFLKKGISMFLIELFYDEIINSYKMDSQSVYKDFVN